MAGSMGRGRLAREKMFGPTYLRRAGRSGLRLNQVAQNYFFGPTPPTGPGPNQNWPWTVTQISFQSDPFNTAATPLYQDVSTRTQALNTARGRQYELDQISAGESTFTLLDPDEALNPTNLSSPYYPGVKVYRRIIDQAMWPPTPAQVTAVPLNSNPYFESTASPWTSTGNATVARSTAQAHSGIASLQITPDGVTSNPGAVSETLTAYPGVNYTLSSWMFTADPGVTRHLQVYWYDSTGAVISNNDISVSITQNVWTFASGVFLSPTNAAFMQIQNIGSGTVNSIWYQDETMLTPTSGVNLMNLAGGGYLSGYDFGIDPTFEVFPVGSFLAFFSPFGGAGTVNVQSTTPYTGSRYIEGVLNAGSGSPQGIAVTLICIPGMTYTFSCYGMISTGSTSIQLQILNGPTGVRATPTSYVRFSVTFTATDVIHIARLQTVGTINSAALRMDSVQFEQGPVATTFTAYGPTVFGVFKGYVERFPVSWNYTGTYGMSSLTCVDSLAILANQSIYGEIRNETLFQQPAYYWPLDDGQGALYFGEKSGNAGPELTIVNATNGKSTVTSGTTVKITGDPGGTAVEITGGTPGTNTAGSTLQTVKNTVLTLGGSGTSWGITLMANVILPASVAGPILFLTNATSDFLLSIELDGSATPGIFGRLITSGGNFTTTNVGTSSATIELILFLTVQISGGNTKVRVRDIFSGIDNSFTTANTTVWGTSSPTANFGVLALGGLLDSYNQVVGPQCTFSHVAVWSKVLTDNTMNFLFDCASNGVGGESPGDRISRYIDYAALPSDGRFIDSGVSTMTAAAVGGTGDTSILDAIQNVGTSDNGTFYIDENGVSVFQDRDTRYLSTTPSWVFGEDVASGEIPYIEGISYDFDSTQVYNDIKCTRVSGVTVFNDNGITAVGGTPTEIATSRHRYGTKSLSRDLNITSDLETQDAANWLFASHKDPMQRIAQLAIQPSSNPASWVAALGIRIGDRVTVRRRTRQYSAYNQTGNFTMSADYFIERIEHSREPGKWTVTYQMSPVGGVAGLQPWILENQTYGVLDQTTLLGY